MSPVCRHSMRRKRIRKSPSDRRAEIVDAAATIALAEGLECITLRRVAEQLGVRPGLISHYFPAVEDLVAGAFGTAAGAELNALLPTDRAAGTPRDHLARFFTLVTGAACDDISRLFGLASGTLTTACRSGCADCWWARSSATRRTRTRSSWTGRSSSAACARGYRSSARTTRRLPGPASPPHGRRGEVSPTNTAPPRLCRGEARTPHGVARSPQAVRSHPRRRRSLPGRTALG